MKKLIGVIVVFFASQFLYVSAAQLLTYNKSSPQLTSLAVFMINLDQDIGNGDPLNVDEIQVSLQGVPPATRDPRTNPVEGDSLTVSWEEYNEDDGYCYSYTERLSYSASSWTSTASSSKRGKQLFDPSESSEENDEVPEFDDGDC